MPRSMPTAGDLALVEDVPKDYKFVFNEITFPCYQARLGRPLLSHLQPSLLDDRDCFCKDLKPAHQFHNLFVFVVTPLCNLRNVLK